MQIIEKAKGRNEAGSASLQQGVAEKDKGEVFAGVNEFANPLPEQFRQPISDMLRNKFGKDGLPFIQREDPRQTEALIEAERRAKNIEAGTDVSTQQAIDSARKTTGATQQRLSRLTGGNVGSAVDALVKAQRAGQESSNAAIAQGQQRLPFFLNLGQQLRNRVAQRRLELDLLDRAQTSAERAQAQKVAGINAQRAEGADIAMGGQDQMGTEDIMGMFGEIQGRSQGDVAKMDKTQVQKIDNAPDGGGMPALTSLMGGGGGDAAGGMAGGMDFSQMGNFASMIPF